MDPPHPASRTPHAPTVQLLFDTHCQPLPFVQYITIHPRFAFGQNTSKGRCRGRGRGRETNVTASYPHPDPYARSTGSSGIRDRPARSRV